MTALKKSLVISIAIVLLMPMPVWSAEIAITTNSPLAFGSFAAGSGGTMTVSTSGLCSAGGNVVIIDSGCSNAEFLVTGDPSTTYSITLPDGLVTLTGPGNDMAIDSFVSDPALLGFLSSGGSQILSVGGTLNVGSNQAAGSYSGSFSVIVQYN